jgi:hypothetical protein
MVLNFFGQLTNVIGKGERLPKVAEVEALFKLFDAVSIQHSPAGDLFHQRVYLCLVNPGGISSTGFAVLFG